MTEIKIIETYEGNNLPIESLGDFSEKHMIFLAAGLSEDFKTMESVFKDLSPLIGIKALGAEIKTEGGHKFIALNKNCKSS